MLDTVDVVDVNTLILKKVPGRDFQFGLDSTLRRNRIRFYYGDLVLNLIETNLFNKRGESIIYTNGDVQLYAYIPRGPQ
jgi:hypothetical protein